MSAGCVRDAESRLRESGTDAICPKGYTIEGICEMEEQQLMIRVMNIEDYDEVYALWMEIHGFGIRSIDDSKEGVARFLRRNPTTSMVATAEGKLVGAILCGHDGRRGCLYHVCVREAYRKHGIGQKLVQACLKALKEEQINKVNLIAFEKNTVGNHFWQGLGWSFRSDVKYYEYVLEEANVTTYNP